MPEDLTGRPEDTTGRMTVTRRRVGFGLIFGALVPLAVAATAWGCGLLATLNAGTSVANPGQTLTVTGVNYEPQNGVTATNLEPTHTPVQIRWNSRYGPIIKEVTPDGEGKISTTVQVPDVGSGWYVLNATQFSLNGGLPRRGTPGRTTVRVQGEAGSSTAASPWSTSKPAGPGGAAVAVDDSSASPALFPTLLGIVLSLTLLGTGVTLVGRARTRAGNRPLLGA